MCVEADGFHLAGEFGGTDDVDAGDGQQQRVGSPGQASGEFAFRGLDFPRFLRVIVMECQGNASAGLGSDIGRGGPSGPVEDFVKGAFLIADGGLAEAACQAGGSSGVEFGRGGEVPGAIASENIREAAGEAREDGVEVLAGLTAQFGGLKDQIAAADEELQSLPDFAETLFGGGESLDGGAVESNSK